MARAKKNTNIHGKCCRDLKLRKSLCKRTNWNLPTISIQIRCYCADWSGERNEWMLRWFIQMKTYDSSNGIRRKHLFDMVIYFHSVFPFLNAISLGAKLLLLWPFWMAAIQIIRPLFGNHLWFIHISVLTNYYNVGEHFCYALDQIALVIRPD